MKNDPRSKFKANDPTTNVLKGNSSEHVYRIETTKPDEINTS